ncbi:MAG: radical SAM protein [Deltaproteobacteria bacterium]|jgi:hypothetical protein|nr:radical SAM protein [Deltaproteobacteria bacterium]
MCHFNGPEGKKKRDILKRDQIERALDMAGEPAEITFAGTGEFLVDENAVDYMRMCADKGHKPALLTNGQLLTPGLMDEMLSIGTRQFFISVDAIDAKTYSRVRRGGKFEKILSACAHLRERQSLYPDIRVQVSHIMFAPPQTVADEIVNFWRDKVDVLLLRAEYYDNLFFRNTFYPIPRDRCHCPLSLTLTPSGHISPCCAMTLLQHMYRFPWMPHIDTHTLDEASTLLTDMYNAKGSKFNHICQKCQWWIMFYHRPNIGSPYSRTYMF